MTGRSITAAARQLQSAANRLELAARNRDRDRILATLFADGVKGRRAAVRLEAQAPALAALEAEVERLRGELGALLDRVGRPARELPEFEISGTEPTRKRKK